MFQRLSLIIAICLCSFFSIAQSLNQSLHNAPAWIDEASEQLFEHGFQPSLKKGRSQKLLLRAGHWLDIPSELVNKLKVYEGNTLHLVRQLSASDWICRDSRCQLTSSAYARIITLVPQENIMQNALILSGAYVHSPSGFRRALKLPLAHYKISGAHDLNTYYILPKNHSAKVFFPEAKKLKLTIRKSLHQIATNNQVTVSINGSPIATLKVNDTLSEEYEEYKVSTPIREYIFVPKDSYLELSSNNDVLVQLTQEHRGIFDTDAPQKQQEQLFNPVWNKTFANRLAPLFTKKDFSVFDEFNHAVANQLERKRQSELLQMSSRVAFLEPSSPSSITNHIATSYASNTLSKYASKVQTESITVGLQNFQNRLISRRQNTVLRTHTLHRQLNFSLENMDLTRGLLTFYASSQNLAKAKLIMNEGQVILPLTFHPNGYFQRIRLPIPRNTKHIELVLTHGENIQVALQVEQLADLPKNQNWYEQPGLLSEKAPFIAKYLQREQSKTAQSYLARLPAPWEPEKRRTSSSLSMIDELHQLGEAQYLSQHDPSQALQKIKPLFNSNNSALLLGAWKLRIALLDKLKQPNVATRYLESLLRTKEPQLQIFAAHHLMSRYRDNQQGFKLYALCAFQGYAFSTCYQDTLNVLYQQGKLLQALWLGHDLPRQSDIMQKIMTAVGFTARSYHSPAPKNSYQITHFGKVTVKNETSAYQMFVLPKNGAIRFRSEQPVTLKISARSASLQQKTYKTDWLYLDTKNATQILPIYTDIESTTVLSRSGLSLSVGSQSEVLLPKGKTLTLHASNEVFLTLQVNTAYREKNTFFPNESGQLFLGESIETLLNRPEVSLRTLMTNALYQLNQGTLSNKAYAQLYAKLYNQTLPTHLEKLKSRIDSFGAWQPMNHFKDFAGTQLVELSIPEQKSLAEQISRHQSFDSNLSGILLRPYHQMNLDVSDYAQNRAQLRLVFQFSSSELYRQFETHVEIHSPSGDTLWPVLEHEKSIYGLTQSDLSQGVISLRWPSPNLAQLLSVNIEVQEQGQWKPLQTLKRFLFYRADEQHPVVAQLKSDQFVKMEFIDNNRRREKQFFHPAGVLSIPSSYVELSRLFTWQISERRSKIGNPEQFIALTPYVDNSENTLLRAPKDPKNFTVPTHTYTNEVVNLEGFINYQNDDIRLTTDPLPASKSLDLGINLRLGFPNDWIKFTLERHFEESGYDAFTASSNYYWLSDTQDWFGEVNYALSWQPSVLDKQGQFADQIRFSLGQLWRTDTGWRHQWWLTPYFRHSSVSRQEFIDDTDISSKLFSFYRKDHHKGLQARYQIRYQPWVDTQLSMTSSLNTNANFSSIDNVGFSWDWKQYYQGHILSLGLNSNYVFADEHRANGTWQYLINIDWQKRLKLSNRFASFFRVRWTQDWFNGGHSLNATISLGNLSSSGFNPYAPDEVLFGNLQQQRLFKEDTQ